MSDIDTQDFAAFEAAAAEPVVIDNDKPAEEAKVADTVVTEDEPLDLNEDQIVEEGEQPADEHGRRRSKPMTQRISELTARLRETERQLEAERSGKEKPAEAPTLEKPDPSQFEFGEADPDYIDKLTDWKLDVREIEKAKANEASQSQQAVLESVNNGVAKAEEAAKAKYDDFDAKITEAVDARGGEPLPPLLTIGISVSPVGGDILYRLATDEAASARLEKLAKGGMQTSHAMAMALGELEGEYLDDDSDTDLDMTDNLDQARMMGRLRARIKGTRAAAPQSRVSVTNAPEPPQQRARGGSGQFTVDGTTTDFAAFERAANGKR